MRLLFDQNLAPRLVRSLADLYSDSLHLRDVGLASADAAAVWDYAKQNALTIVCPRMETFISEASCTAILPR